MSNRPGREISEEERRYEDGTDPQVLDIIQICMLESAPRDHQRENHVIDADYYWTRKGRVSWQTVQNAVEDPQGPLWINGHSTYRGINDKVPEELAKQQTRSLYLVRPQQLRLIVGREGMGPGEQRRRVRAEFILSGIRYRLVVTDPAVEQRYFQLPDGETRLNDALITVSLAEPVYGFAFKLAAAIITPENQ